MTLHMLACCCAMTTPAAPCPPAAGSLPLSEHDQAVGGTGTGELANLVVGGFHRFAWQQPERFREVGGLRVELIAGHRAS